MAFTALPAVVQWCLVLLILIAPLMSLFWWLHYRNDQQTRGALVGFGGCLLSFVYYYHLLIFVNFMGLLSYLARNSQTLRSEWGIAVGAEAAVNFSILVAYTAFLVPLYRRSEKYPRFYSYLCVISILIPVIDYIVLYASACLVTNTFSWTVAKRLGEELFMLYYGSIKILGTLLLPAISLIYLRTSRRARNTFTNRGARREPSPAL